VVIVMTGDATATDSDITTMQARAMAAAIRPSALTDLREARFRWPSATTRLIVRGLVLKDSPSRTSGTASEEYHRMPSS
jgi:hypothetical protein